MSRISRLPVRTSQLLEPGTVTGSARGYSRNENRRTRASSTSRASNSMALCTPSLRRSKSSASLKRTPQSVHGSADKQKIRKKDGRPLQDKKWQADMLRKTQEYFRNDPQGASILNQGKNIRPITNTMFIQLVNIILGYIDDKFEMLTTSNYVDLLPRYLNILMYPGNVTPSMMKTANTMHTWPHILGILSWLVGVSENVRRVDGFFEDDENMFMTRTDLSKNELRDLQIQQLEAKTLISSFVKWNRAESTDDVFEKYRDDLKEILKTDYASIKNLKQTLDKLTTQKAAENEIIERQNEEIQELEAKSEKLTENIKYAEDILTQQREYSNKIQVKIAKIKKDIQKLYEKDEKYIQNISQLELKLKNQKMSKEDRDITLRIIEEVEAQRAVIQNEMKQVQLLSDAIDIRKSQKKLEMEKEISAYNMMLLKKGLKHAELNNLAVDSNSLRGTVGIQYLEDKVKETEKFYLELEEKSKVERHSQVVLKQEYLQEQHEAEEVKRDKETRLSKIEDLKRSIQEKKDEEARKEKMRLELSATHKVEINLLKDKIPDVEEIRKRIQEKTKEYHSLKENLKRSALSVLNTFENLERDVDNRIIPEFQGIRGQITQTMLTYQNQLIKKKEELEKRQQEK